MPDPKLQGMWGKMDERIADNPDAAAYLHQMQKYWGAPRDERGEMPDLMSKAFHMSANDKQILAAIIDHMYRQESFAPQMLTPSPTPNFGASRVGETMQKR